MPTSASQLPIELGPNPGEESVFSGLLVQDGSSWALVAGSLLTVPSIAARMSWRQWRLYQPHTPALAGHEGILDPGPNFCVEPFRGLRAFRAIVRPAQWRRVVEELSAGEVRTVCGIATADVLETSSTILLGQNGLTAAHDVVAGAGRPVHGAAMTLGERELPSSKHTWELPVPAGLGFGADYARMSRERSVLFWPRELLGIDWLGSSETQPPPRLVIGKAISTAWVAGIRPDFEDESLVASIAWDEQKIDPLSCSLAMRVERDGLLLTERQFRISDLPWPSAQGSAMSHSELRSSSWNERTMDVRLPRAGRRTDWSLRLYAPDGRLLDERPMATRVDAIRGGFQVGGSSEVSETFVAGDKKPPPTNAERDASLGEAHTAEAAAREAAARRRLSTSGELTQYLRWRFSLRAGELLILDPYLFDDRPTDVLQFLIELDRPVRALTRVLPRLGSGVDTSRIHIGSLPNGKGSLHDRIWIVGETGVLVGASAGGFLADPKRRRATTASDLPLGDTLLWRDRFEAWWDEKPR